jgi:hypothetical protein
MFLDQPREKLAKASKLAMAQTTKNQKKSDYPKSSQLSLAELTLPSHLGAKVQS